MNTKLKISISVLLAMSLTSCSLKEQLSEVTSVTVSAGIANPDMKVTLNQGHTQFLWSEGDAVNIFTDSSDESYKLDVNSTLKLTVPSSTRKLYGFYPYDEALVLGPSAVLAKIEPFFTQAEAGKFDIPSYPMSASAAIVAGESTELLFTPMVTVLALNIYKSKDATEKITKVRVTPRNNTAFAGEAVVDLTVDSPAFVNGDESVSSVCVTLGTPCSIPEKAPVSTAEKKAFATQIYVPLARQEYSGMQFEVDTDKGNHYFILAGEDIVFDGTSSDIILTGINLEGKTVETVEGSIGNPNVIEDTEEIQTEDMIPDFSRVGYHHGDDELPSYPVKATITPQTVSAALSSKAFPDTTSYIQSVIDAVGSNGGGAVLIKNGTYNIGSFGGNGMLILDWPNTVIRGESRTGTILKATGKAARPLIFMGRTVNNREIVVGEKELAEQDEDGNKEYVTKTLYFPKYTSPVYLSSSKIREDYVPAGRMWVEVDNPGIFAVGQKVSVYRPGTSAWVHDIKMDRIASPAQPWKPKEFSRHYRRRVTAIKGNRIFLDEPVVMSMSKEYGGGYLYIFTWDTIQESGIENITLDSAYDASKTEQSSRIGMQPSDEEHAWYAIRINSAEHCWVKDVTSKHFGMSHTYVHSGDYITVKNCASEQPVSICSGGRRYAFYSVNGQNLLFYECTCDSDRHAFVTSGSCGPIVFYNCKATNCNNDLGPHQRWSAGVLYDNVSADKMLLVRDRGNAGDGHGWAGANHVFWNCESKWIMCQSPWASAKNYCVGGKGSNYVFMNDDAKAQGLADYDASECPSGRPHGEWFPSYPKFGYNGTDAGKVNDIISLPNANGAKLSWWPKLTKTSFTNPNSLYLSQLEDRHYCGINLNNVR